MADFALCVIINMRNWIDTSVTSPCHIAEWNRICDKMELKEQAFIEKMKALGVAAAHPNDAWVRDDERKFTLTYPSFNDGVKVGSIVALGDCDKHRLVRVTEIKPSPLGIIWHYFEKIKKPRKAK